MPKVALQGNPYQGQASIASAQRAVNLYAESNAAAEGNSPFPFTEYPTPGSILFGAAIVPAGGNGAVRGCYRTTIGTAYCVVGPTIYFVELNGGLTFVGALEDQPSPVSFADNGEVMVIVDGTTSGYAIDLVSNDFGLIIDPSFYGANVVVYLSTFFIFNRPGTNQFYTSLSLVTFIELTTGTSFNPLSIAGKSGSADPIISIITVYQNLWLIGALTTEIWIGTGAAAFYFQQIQGAYINHGCSATFSAATQDVLLFWLQQDLQGRALILQGTGLGVTEISTPYIVAQIQKYATISDAIGFCFQTADHAFYALIFPTANKCWLYELNTKRWCEWVWLDANGNYNRPRANCYMFFNAKNIVGDWQTGQLFTLDFETYTDNGSPIVRERTFPHMIMDGQRVVYTEFTLSISVGTAVPAEQDINPTISLSWSDDGGITYSQQVEQVLGAGGEFLTQPSWKRLGMARDRIFKVKWSAPYNIAINGAYVDSIKAAS